MFRDSSAAHLLDLRRRLKAVMDVLDVMIRDGVSLARSVELLVQWDGSLRWGLLVLSLRMIIWLLGGVVLSLVDLWEIFIVGFRISSRRQLCIVGMWQLLLGGVGSRRTLLFIPSSGLGPDLVLPAPFLQCQAHLLVFLGFWRILPELMRNSEKPGFPTFVALGKGVPALRNSLMRLKVGCLLFPEVSLPDLTGEMLADVVRREGVTADVLDGWGWRELEVLLVVWYDGLARILAKVEEIGVWPDGLLDACIAMIPKVDGDATPLGQQPLSVRPVVYRIWASARIVQLEAWFRSWVPKSVFSAGGGCSSVEAWYTTALCNDNTSHVYFLTMKTV